MTTGTPKEQRSALTSIKDLFKPRGTTDIAKSQQQGEPAADGAGDQERRAGPLAWLTRIATEVTTRVANGAPIVARRVTVRVAAWCRAGRRDDLEGVSAELGVYVRVGMVAAGLYGGWRLVDARPVVMWPVAVLYSVAALRAASPKRKPAAGAGEEAGTGAVEPPVVAVTRATIGADTGVHLADLYPALRAGVEGLAGADDVTLRQALADHRIVVQRSMRARGVAGRSGVRLADLPPLPSPDSSPDGSTLHSPPLSTDGEPGQGGGAESGGEQRRVAESGPESGGERVRLVQDAHNPARWHVA